LKPAIDNSEPGSKQVATSTIPPVTSLAAEVEPLGTISPLTQSPEPVTDAETMDVDENDKGEGQNFIDLYSILLLTFQIA
jgi:hypothetical protein